MKALVVGGPTASGKTALSVELALAFDAVILSADAMQVYRGMDIGTGKATAEERRGVTHFGLDLREPDEAFDVADFVALAEDVISQHPRVIVAGGTSLYLNALRRGLVETPRPDEARRAAWTEAGGLHARLTAVDPELADRLHPNDTIRLLRGLEVHADLGIPLSRLQAEHRARPDRVTVDGVWLDADDLDARIDARVLEMLDQGLVDETRRILLDHAPDIKPLRSLGYRHIVAMLAGDTRPNEAVRLTQRDSRRFARKQRTWGKHLPLRSGRDEAFRAAEALWATDPDGDTAAR